MLKTLDKTSNKPTLSWEIVTISPEMAAAWLEKNTANRPMSKKSTAAYSRDMKAGKWRLTGDPIRFDAKGRLLDGQHRLQACIDADTPFTTIVVYGLDPATQSVIDTARPRTVSDTLAMHGQHSTIMLASMIRQAIALRAGLEDSSIKATNSEILQFLKERPDIVNSCGKIVGRAIASRNLPKGIPGSMLGVVHWAATRNGWGHQADAFIEVFTTGIPAYKGCPAHALRERLLRQSAERAILSRRDTFRSMIHAWNLFRKREAIQFFRYPGKVTMTGLDVDKL